MVWLKIVSLMVGIQMVTPLFLGTMMLIFNFQLTGPQLELLLIFLVLFAPFMAGIILGKHLGKFSFQKFKSKEQREFIKPLVLLCVLAVVIKIMSVVIGQDVAAIFGPMLSKFPENPVGVSLFLSFVLLVGVGKVVTATIIPAVIGTQLAKK